MKRDRSSAVAMLIVMLVGCGGDDDRVGASGGDNNERVSELVRVLGRDLPFDSLFELRAEVVLEQPDDHVIGGPGDMALDSAGNIYLVDFRMKDVKSWTSDGKFRGILGSTGQGPGEYSLPISVAIGSEGDIVGVMDVATRHIVLFDAASLEHVRTLALESPVSTQGLILAQGDTLLIVGSGNYRAEIPYNGAVFVAQSSSVDLVREILPLPERLQGKVLGANIIGGMADRWRTTLFSGIRGSRAIYRGSIHDLKVDSIYLPIDFYQGLDLPKLGSWTPDGPKAFESLYREQALTGYLLALSDSTTLVGISKYDQELEEWVNRWGLLTWGPNSHLRYTEYCLCFGMVAKSDRIGFFAGEFPDPGPYRIEWRAPRYWEESSIDYPVVMSSGTLLSSQG